MSRRVITQEEFLAEAKARFGDNVRDWQFVCPACGTVQSVQQLLDAVLADGGTKEDVHGYIGYTCIGRFTGQRDQGQLAKARGETWTKGCNWTLGGFLQIHELEVAMPEGRRPVFALAPALVTVATGGAR